jgi:3-deoxy-manno-octulosonate cytidylyltransferase (CMP-KDO synthetase)
VATDSREVLAACEAAGAAAVMTSAEHASGTDRVAEVARAPEFQLYDTIVNVQGDEPFVSEEALHGAARMVSDGRFPLGTVAVPGEEADLDSPDVVKVVVTDSGRALYFSRAPIPWLRSETERQMRAACVLRHVGVYAYSRVALQEWVRRPVHPLEQIERLEQLRPLAAGTAMGVAVVRSPTLPGVDTENDLARANASWNDFTSGNF